MTFLMMRFTTVLLGAISNLAALKLLLYNDPRKLGSLHILELQHCWAHTAN